MDILRTTFHQQIPQAFFYENEYGVKELVGSYAQLLKHFAIHRNYTLELIQEENYKISTIQREIERRIFNISLHSGSTYRNKFANIAFSYPLEWSNVCIMVHAEEALPKYRYIIYPFGPYIWTFLCLTIMYAAYMMKYLKHPTVSFLRNLFFSLPLILYSPNMNLRWINISWRQQWFYSLMLIMGFIISSYYNSFLTAYNMRPIFQPFMRTTDDILRANIKVLISYNLLEALRNNSHVDLSALEPVFEEMPQREISYAIHNLSHTFAYVVTQNEWKFLVKLQRNLIQPIYQLSDVCFGDVLNTFPLQLHSKFGPSLDYFILLIQQSGLWDYWEEEAFMSAISAKYFHIFKDSYPLDPLNLKYYKIAWIVLIGGVIISSVCIIVEILYFRYKIKKVNKISLNHW